MKNGIICAGNWVIDKVKLIDRFPEEGTLCNISSQIRSTGGGPANVSFDIAAMDPAIPLYAAGRIGNDDDGRFVLDEIKARAIDSTGMVVDPKLPTSYTDVMSGNGKRTFFHCRGACSEYGFDDVKKLDAPAKFFYLAYLLLLEKMDRSDPEYGTEAARALDYMGKKGYKTVVDFVSDAPEKFRAVVLPALPYIDILIVNEIESSSCSGIELRRADGSMNYANLPAAVDFLFAHGVRETAVIHFPEGAAGRTREGKFLFRPSCNIPMAEIAGSTGAGDAFAAGVIYALHQGWALEKAMELGAASSHFNLRSATATGGAVSLEKMQNFLKTCVWNPVPAEFSEGKGK